jgi:hypothetical protein
MSPTSYQTAPPRDKAKIINALSDRVKLILNKINGLRKQLILLGLSLEHRIIERFPSPKQDLPQIYHRFQEPFQGSRHCNQSVRHRRERKYYQ